MPLIGNTAPAFKAMSTQGEIKFPEDYRGKWVILFSHPGDFTPVCTTEFVMFQKYLPEFKKLNTELIGVSVDSNAAHIAWLKAIEEKIEFKGIKNQKITFPLLDDLNQNVAKLYGMVPPHAANTMPVRAVFFIDPNAKVRALIYYPARVGRNFEEIKRTLVALQMNDEFGVATPADWQPGDDVVIGSPANMNAVDELAKDKSAKRQDWFLSFREFPKSEIEKKLKI